jgi:predicted DNA binding CopG/RHH family protein
MPDDYRSRSSHPEFRPLGRCAPVAVNSGLRPETHLNNAKIQCRMEVQKTTLFKKAAPGTLRDQLINIRLSKDEVDAIKHSAAARQLPMADFIRRAALGRRADVDYVTQTVLQLSEVVRAIRQVHKDMLDRHIAPPVALWSPIMDQAEAAMLRIGQ